MRLRYYQREQDYSETAYFIKSPVTYLELDLNKHASTIQNNTGAAGLVSESQLELEAILRVRIGCHR